MIALTRGQWTAALTGYGVCPAYGTICYQVVQPVALQYRICESYYVYRECLQLPSYRSSDKWRRYLDTLSVSAPTCRGLCSCAVRQASGLDFSGQTVLHHCSCSSLAQCSYVYYAFTSLAWVKDYSEAYRVAIIYLFFAFFD